MQITRTDNNPASVTLKITANIAELEPIKKHVLGHFAGKVSIPGFRQGTAPSSMLEKYVDQKALADEFMEHALNSFYRRAVEQEGLRTVAPPRIELKKFVPFSLLEFDVHVDILGPIKLPDYKKIKLAKPTTSVSVDEVTQVVKSLQKQLAERKEVERPAKAGDEAVIDFKGTDTQGEPVKGADGKDYSLALGSATFIPGFEDNLIGAKAGEDKIFTLTFPKDYGAAVMQGKKVTFTVQVKKIHELVEPKADDAFAAKAGPFKTLKDLKVDIKKQLMLQKERESQSKYENELVQKIVDKSVMEVPAGLIDDQIRRAEEEEKRNLVFRGETWQEHLAAEGISEDQHRERHRPSAEASVKAGLILGEIAEKEGVVVTPEELELRVQLLKGQHTDPGMQAELDKPENRGDIAARLRLEKTLAKLVTYAQS